MNFQETHFLPSKQFLYVLLDCQGGKKMKDGLQKLAEKTDVSWIIKDKKKHVKNLIGQSLNFQGEDAKNNTHTQILDTDCLAESEIIFDCTSSWRKYIEFDV